jgi:hypothetical protein
MFTTELQYKKSSHSTHTLTASLKWLDGNISIEVMDGFTFDGASIPRLFWSLIGSPFTGHYTRAACLHDALYVSEMVSRSEADKMLYKAMITDGTRRTKAMVMYLAVRACGWYTWSKHTKQSVREWRKYVKISTVSIDDSSCGCNA